jgi:hypothetical protein
MGKVKTETKKHKCHIQIIGIKAFEKEVKEVDILIKKLNKKIKAISAIKIKTVRTDIKWKGAI